MYFGGYWSVGVRLLVNMKDKFGAVSQHTHVLPTKVKSSLAHGSFLSLLSHEWYVYYLWLSKFCFY